MANHGNGLPVLDDALTDRFGRPAKVTGFVDRDGNPVDPPAAPNHAGVTKEDTTITISVRDPEAFLDAFATVFEYSDTVPSVENPAERIPNPTSRADFATAIIRAYVASVIKLAERKRAAQTAKGDNHGAA